MKIRYKLIILTIIAAIVPLIILSVYANSNATSLASESQINILKSITADKSLYINDFMRELSINVKDFASDDGVREYVSKCSEEGYDGTWEGSEYTCELIQKYMKLHEDVNEMYILDNRGTIIAANDTMLMGSPAENKQEIEGYLTNNNGISNVIAPKDGNGNTFYVVRRIYSPEGSNAGILCLRIDLSKICKSLDVRGYSNYVEIMIVDNEGKYIVGNSSTPKKLESVSEYKGIPDALKQVIPCYGSNNLSSETVMAEYDDKVVCGAVITAADWSVISYYDCRAARTQLKKNFTGIETVCFVLIAAAAVAVIAIGIIFTHPINEILNVIRKVNKGDTNTRLDFNSNDEFGELSDAFNKVFDNIFESEQRYRTVVSMMDNIVFELNIKTNKVYVSNNFNQKFSFRPVDDSFEESFLKKMKIHKDDAKRFGDDLNKIIASGGEKWEGEYRFKNIYGDFSWIRIRVRKYYDRNNSPAKIIGMLADIDREKKSAINLMQKANYDALTQLYNRATFIHALDDEMQLSVARRSLDALMFIDLDDFKHFNDEYGHKCGDEVLKFVAETIKEVTFDSGFGGRLGGDEFVVCLTNLKLIGDAGKIAADVIATLNEGFVSESTGLKLNIHCSIGIAFFRENGGNSTELLESADSAMYRIKRSGKSNYAYANKNETKPK